MARLMIGRNCRAASTTRVRPAAKSACAWPTLARRGRPFGTDLRDLHLDVHAGEIVGIAGVSATASRSCCA